MTASKCASGRGRAITGGAACASACVLVLAGGVERLVGPVPLVGVHQITAVQKLTEGVDHLTQTRKVYEPARADAVVETYLTAMGVGEPVMTLMRQTPAASIRWLSDGELRASRLATLRLDGAAPILAAGANGLNGHPFDGDPLRPDLLTAVGTAPPAHDHGPALVATFAYRRGGGAIEATIAALNAEPKPAPAPPDNGSKLTAASDSDEFPLRKPVDGAPTRVILPRRRLLPPRPGRQAHRRAGPAPRGAIRSGQRQITRTASRFRRRRDDRRQATVRGGLPLRTASRESRPAI